MKQQLILIFLMLISFGSCSENPHKPKNLITEDTYIDLLVELQLVRSYGETTKADSLTVDSLILEVFKKYDITAENFWTSHRYYQQFPSEQKIRIEQAIERLKMDQVENTSEDSTSADH